MIGTINNKMTTNSQLSTTKSRKNKLGKQLEQEQSHRDEDHMEGYQWGGGGGRMVEKIQGIRNIAGGCRIDGRCRESYGKLKSQRPHM